MCVCMEFVILYGSVDTMNSQARWPIVKNNVIAYNLYMES